MQANANKREYFLKVALDDLNNFDEKIAKAIRMRPAEYLPMVLQLFRYSIDSNMIIV